MRESERGGAEVTTVSREQTLWKNILLNNFNHTPCVQKQAELDLRARFNRPKRARIGLS